MMHSLLTVLPDLYEEGDEPAVQPEPKPEPETPTDTADRPIKAEDEEDPASLVPEGVAPVIVAPADPPSGPEAADSSSTAQGTAEDPEGRHTDDASAVPTTESTTTDPPASDDVPLPAGGAETEEEEELGARSVDATSPPDAAGEVKDEPLEPPLPVVENENEDEKSAPPRTASPEPLEREPRPHRARISVTALLRHADELFAQYPPSHPGIALASIMGPKSVMLTWSERASELPTDDEAELMVTRPELVVQPYVEEPAPEDGDEDGEREKSEKRRREERRRKLRKPRRLTDMVVQRKTMVAGAVLVLGVAMAVYGFNGGLPGGNGHNRHGFSREWRKVGRLLGGALMGAGGRVFEGFRRGLQ